MQSVIILFMCNYLGNDQPLILFIQMNIILVLQDDIGLYYVIL